MNEFVILMLIFTVMIIVKIPIAYALGLSSLAVIFMMGIPLTTAINAMYNSVHNFPLLAIPLFMLLALLMEKGGITTRLFGMSDAFVGHIRGGLGHVNVFVSLLFGHLSGSAQADVAGIGSVIIPTMKKAGYPIGFTVAITATSSTLGVILPPSVLMVVYGAMSGVSIGALFVAGIVPGFLIAFIQMAYVYYMATKHKWPKGERHTWKQRGDSVKNALPVVLLPIIIVGGTSSGMFTATESAAIGCLYALVLMFIVYRSCSIKDIPQVMVSTARTFSLTMFAVASAGMMGWLIAFLNLPRIFADFILGITDTYLGVYLLLVLFLLFVGAFLGGITIIIIFMPIIAELGAIIDANGIHLGMIVILTISIGIVTPPYGSCLMIASQIGGIPMNSAFMSVLPICILIIALIIVFIIFPEIILFLPRILVPAAFPS